MVLQISSECYQLCFFFTCPYIPCIFFLIYFLGLDFQYNVEGSRHSFLFLTLKRIYQKFTIKYRVSYVFLQILSDILRKFLSIPNLLMISYLKLVLKALPLLKIILNTWQRVWVPFYMQKEYSSDSHGLGRFLCNQKLRTQGKKIVLKYKMRELFA